MAVEAMKLTALACDRLRSTATRCVIRDTGSRSLFLIVAPTRSKSWLIGSGAPTESRQK
jgi:hypothetical protein